LLANAFTAHLNKSRHAREAVRTQYIQTTGMAAAANSIYLFCIKLEKLYRNSLAVIQALT
jgi:hypothetical protein